MRREAWWPWRSRPSRSAVPTLARKQARTCRKTLSHGPASLHDARLDDGWPRSGIGSRTSHKPPGCAGRVLAMASTQRLHCRSGHHTPPRPRFQFAYLRQTCATRCARQPRASIGIRVAGGGGLRVATLPAPADRPGIVASDPTRDRLCRPLEVAVHRSFQDRAPEACERKGPGNSAIAWHRNTGRSRTSWISITHVAGGLDFLGLQAMCGRCPFLSARGRGGPVIRRGISPMKMIHRRPPGDTALAIRPPDLSAVFQRPR